MEPLPLPPEAPAAPEEAPPPAGAGAGVPEEPGIGMPVPEEPLVPVEPEPLPEVDAPDVPLPDVPGAMEPLAPDVPLPDAPLLLEAPAAPELPVAERFFDFLACFFALCFLAAFLSAVASVPAVPDAPEEVAPAGDDCFVCAMSFACCSTAAALAGSVLVVTPLEEVCADAIPANDINEMKRTKDTFFMLTSM